MESAKNITKIFSRISDVLHDGDKDNHTDEQYYIMIGLNLVNHQKTIPSRNYINPSGLNLW